MSGSRGVAAVAALSALVVGSNFALAPYPNVKLWDTVVFLAAFVFGARVGAGVALVSETAWSFVSPWGPAGAIAPFLIGGELLFVAAGWGAARLWGGPQSGKVLERSVYMGALMLACAFAWDLETNAATALVAYWPGLTMEKLVPTMAAGIPFAIYHEAADFIFGVSVAPLAIAAAARVGVRW